MEIIVVELIDNKYEGLNVPSNLIDDVKYIETIVINPYDHLVLSAFIQNPELKEHLFKDVVDGEEVILDNLEQTIAKQKLIEYLNK
jgi:hypothetical protein